MRAVEAAERLVERELRQQEIAAAITTDVTRGRQKGCEASTKENPKVTFEIDPTYDGVDDEDDDDGGDNSSTPAPLHDLRITRNSSSHGGDRAGDSAPPLPQSNHAVVKMLSQRYEEIMSSVLERQASEISSLHSSSNAALSLAHSDSIRVTASAQSRLDDALKEHQETQAKCKPLVRELKRLELERVELEESEAIATTLFNDERRRLKKQLNVQLQRAKPAKKREARRKA